MFRYSGYGQPVCYPIFRERFPRGGCTHISGHGFAAFGLRAASNRARWRCRCSAPRARPSGGLAALCLSAALRLRCAPCSEARDRAPRTQRPRAGGRWCAASAAAPAVGGASGRAIRAPSTNAARVADRAVCGSVLAAALRSSPAADSWDDKRPTQPVLTVGASEIRERDCHEKFHTRPRCFRWSLPEFIR
jgi:hypothetical protein